MLLFNDSSFCAVDGSRERTRKTKRQCPFGNRLISGAKAVCSYVVNKKRELWDRTKLPEENTEEATPLSQKQQKVSNKMKRAVVSLAEKATSRRGCSKRADFYRRKTTLHSIGVVLGSHRYKPPDPRISNLIGHLDVSRFERNYAFCKIRFAKWPDERETMQTTRIGYGAGERREQ